tara:strand:- start:102 stop:305 length:204 start_codon:yes stop_codon:yes gene_type:complete
MKKTLASFCLVGATLALSACDTTATGDIDTDPPYAMERTATHERPAPAAAPMEVAPAEKVFQRAQMK